MTRIRQLLVACLAAALLGCSGSSSEAAAEGSSSKAMAVTTAEAPAGPQARSLDQAERSNGSARLAGMAEPDAMSQAARVQRARHVIRKGALRVRVESVEDAERKAAAWIQKVGGYIASSDSTDLASDTPELTMSVRIPVGEFDAAMTSFEALGTRLSKKVESEDVTTTIVDLEARLGIMRTQENLYRGMLAKSRSQDEMFNIHSRLMELRSQIESLTAQHKTVSGLASLSTLELTLQQSALAVAAASDPSWAKETWAGALAVLTNAMKSIGSAVIWLLVLAPIWLPLAYVVRALVRSSKRPASPVA